MKQFVPNIRWRDLRRASLQSLSKSPEHCTFSIDCSIAYLLFTFYLPCLCSFDCFFSLCVFLSVHYYLFSLLHNDCLPTDLSFGFSMRRFVSFTPGIPVLFVSGCLLISSLLHLSFNYKPTNTL